MRERIVGTFILGLALSASSLRAQSTAPAQGSPPVVAPDVERAIAELESRFERALAARDRTALDSIVATPFTWVHGSDGRVESREVWLAAAARGMALTGQRSLRTEHGPTLAAYGSPRPHTVVRTSRVQLRDTTAGRESWIRQVHVLVRGEDGAWKFASGQGSLMYEGAALDTALHARYAGTYELSDGRTLVLEWTGGQLMGTLPSGARLQIFLASPTEEAVRTEAIARLRFTLGPDGRPVSAALANGQREAWRAVRRK